MGLWTHACEGATREVAPSAPWIVARLRGRRSAELARHAACSPLALHASARSWGSCCRRWSWQCALAPSCSRSDAPRRRTFFCSDDERPIGACHCPLAGSRRLQQRSTAWRFFERNGRAWTGISTGARPGESCRCECCSDAAARWRLRVRDCRAKENCWLFRVAAVTGLVGTRALCPRQLSG